MPASQPIYSSIAHLNCDSPDSDLRSLLMLVRERHPRDPEVAAALAIAYADSGERMPNWRRASADVASTGGPSSLSTLLAPLFLRCADMLVPKLGVPGRPAGGIDALAQLAGYRYRLSSDEVTATIKSCGYAHFITNESFAPLDGKTFAMRQKIGAKAVPTLVIASLLSKKIAVSLDYAGLDIRVFPHGNFGDNLSEARENALAFIATGENVGIAVAPVLTDGRFPYQPYIGRAEVFVALDDYFRGCGSIWLESHVEQCRKMALAALPANCRQPVADAKPPELAKAFETNLIAQGASRADFVELVARTRKAHTEEVTAITDGFTHYPLSKLRELIVTEQQRVATHQTPFPDPVGIVLQYPPGTWVCKGATIATLRLSAGSSGLRTTVRGLVCQPMHTILGPDLEFIDG